MDAAFVAALRGGEVGTAAELARRFCAMVRERDADALPRWLEHARGGPLAGFADGLRRDRAGPVEGRITAAAASITVALWLTRRVRPGGRECGDERCIGRSDT